MIRISRLALCTIAVTILLSATPVPLPAAVSAGEESRQEAAPAQADSTPQGEDGIAAYYSSRYKGRRTNSGHHYDPKKLTAAHASLPLGSRVKVVNLANGQEVIVTVNDRCRPQKQPFIDLSREAARRLGFLGKGTARVRIIPVAKTTDDA